MLSHDIVIAGAGVPAYVPPLEKTVERYGIGVHLGSDLIAVDGPSRTGR